MMKMLELKTTAQRQQSGHKTLWHAAALACSLLILGSTAARAAPWKADELSKVLSDSARPAEDKARDEGRKPAQVLAFLGVETGMTVLDLMASSGYYTEVLALAVGKDGKVYAHNTPRALSRNSGAAGRALDARINERNLAQISRLDAETTALGLAPGSVDLAITALNFHDTYNSGGAGAAATLLKDVATVLKPGGVFGIIDHIGAAGQNNSSLHRIEVEKVLALIPESDFVVEGQSDVLRNPQDDHSQGVFGELRGDTDRFVLKLRKK